MKKWEYKTVGIRKITDISEFNEVGNEGWELVNVVTAAAIGGFRGIFKREVKQKQNKELLVD